MTYSDKLKDPRWLAFRREFISRRKTEDGAFCDDCGVDTPSKDTLHVHHRHYLAGREPWEYDDESLLLLCPGCHEEVHKTERRARKFVVSLRPHECFELNILLDELEAAKAMGLVKMAFARAKNASRNLVRAAKMNAEEATL